MKINDKTRTIIAIIISFITMIIGYILAYNLYRVVMK